MKPNVSSNSLNSSVKGLRRRQRRRKPRIGERPWSYHSEWTGWDYYQPPLGYGGEYKSSEDLNSFEDENLIRSLTEFGENYEKWFKPDEALSSRSPSECSNRHSNADTSADVASIRSKEDAEESLAKSGDSHACKCKKIIAHLESTAVQCSQIDSTTTASLATAKDLQGTSPRLFVIYLAITLFLALLVSALVAQLSPITPHIQKSYNGNRLPPN